MLALNFAMSQMRFLNNTHTHTHTYTHTHSHGDFTAIVDLPEGEYEYKFFVDGQWLHDPNEVDTSSFICPATLGV